MEGEEDSIATLSLFDDDLGVLWMMCFHCCHLLNFDGINLN